MACLLVKNASNHIEMHILNATNKFMSLLHLFFAFTLRHIFFLFFDIYLFCVISSPLVLYLYIYISFFPFVINYHKRCNKVAKMGDLKNGRSR